MGAHFYFARRAHFHVVLTEQQVKGYAKDVQSFYPLLRAYKQLFAVPSILGAKANKSRAVRRSMSVSKYSSSHFHRGDNDLRERVGKITNMMVRHGDEDSKYKAAKQPKWNQALSHLYPSAPAQNPEYVVFRNEAHYNAMMKQLGGQKYQGPDLREYISAEKLPLIFQWLSFKHQHIDAVKQLLEHPDLFCDASTRNAYEMALFDTVSGSTHQTLMQRELFRKKLPGLLKKVLTKARQEKREDLFLFAHLIARRFLRSCRVLLSEKTILTGTLKQKKIEKNGGQNRKLIDPKAAEKIIDEKTEGLLQTIKEFEALFQDQNVKQTLETLAEKGSATEYRAVTEQLSMELYAIEEAGDQPVSFENFLHFYLRFLKMPCPAENFDPSEYIALKRRSIVLLQRMEKTLANDPRQKPQFAKVLTAVCKKLGCKIQQGQGQLWRPKAHAPLCYEIPGFCEMHFLVGDLVLLEHQMTLKSVPDHIKKNPIFTTFFAFHQNQCTFCKSSAEDTKKIYFLKKGDKIVGQIHHDQQTNQVEFYKEIEGTLYKITSVKDLPEMRHVAELGFSWVASTKNLDGTIEYFLLDQKGEKREYKITSWAPQLALTHLDSNQNYLALPFSQCPNSYFIKNLLQINPIENLLLLFTSDRKKVLQKVVLPHLGFEFTWNEDRKTLCYEKNGKKHFVVKDPKRKVLADHTLLFQDGSFLLRTPEEMVEQGVDPLVHLGYHTSARRHLENVGNAEQQVGGLLALLSRILQCNAIGSHKIERHATVDQVIKSLVYVVQDDPQSLSVEDVRKIANFVERPTEYYEYGPFYKRQHTNSWLAKSRLLVSLIKTCPSNHYAQEVFLESLYEVIGQYCKGDPAFSQIEKLSEQELSDLCSLILSQLAKNPPSSYDEKQEEIVALMKRQIKSNSLMKNRATSHFWRTFFSIEALMDATLKKWMWFKELKKLAGNRPNLPQDLPTHKTELEILALEKKLGIQELIQKNGQGKGPQKNGADQVFLVDNLDNLPPICEKLQENSRTWFVEAALPQQQQEFSLGYQANVHGPCTVAAKETMKHIESSVRAHYAQTPETYTLRAQTNIKETLEREKKTLKKELTRLKAFVIKLEKESDSNDQNTQASHQLAQRGGAKRWRTFEQLTVSFALQKLDSQSDRNIREALFDYYRAKVKLNLLCAAQKRLEERDDNALYEICHRKRQYDEKAHPAVLVFEANTGQVLRRLKGKTTTQGDLIETLLKSSKGLNIAPTGAGKTTILTVIYALLSTTGKNIVSITVLPALFEETKKILKTSLEADFARHIYPFRFQLQENSGVSKDNLIGDKAQVSRFQKIYKDLLLAMRDKRCILRDYKSIGLLRMKFLRILYNQHQGKIDPLDSQHIFYLKKIFSLLRAADNTLLDEPDAKCRSNQELRSEIREGGGNGSIDDTLISGTIEVLQMLATNNKLGLKEDKQKKGITHEERSRILEATAEHYAKKFLERYKIGKDKERYELIEELTKYLLSKRNKKHEPENDGYGLFQVLRKKMQESKKNIDEKKFRQIAAKIVLTKDLLSTILPITLAKESDSDYKRKPVSSFDKIEVAPCHSGRLQKSSSFGNPLERMCYTIQSFLQRPVTGQEVFLYFKKYSHHNLGFEGFRETLQLWGVRDPELTTIKNLLDRPLSRYKDLLEEQKRALAAAGSAVSKKENQLFEYFIVPTLRNIHLSPKVIKMNAYDFTHLFHSVRGISATTEGAGGFQFPQSLRPHNPKDPDLSLGKMIATLMEKTAGDATITPVETIDALLNARNNPQSPPYLGLIDLAGVARKVDPKAVAQKMLHQTEDIQRIGYANGTGKIVHVENAGATTEQSGYYYQAADARGRDVRLPKRAIFALVVQSAKLAEICQAAGRSRGAEQKIKLFCDKSDALLSKENNAHATVKDLLIFAAKNTANIEAGRIYQGQLQELQAQLNQAAFEKLTSLEESFDQTKQFFKKVESLFIHETSAIYQDHSKYLEEQHIIQKEIPTRDILKNREKTLQNKADEFGLNSKIQREKKNQDLINRYILKMAPSTNLHNVDQESEIVNENQNENQLENQNENQLENHNENELENQSENEVHKDIQKKPPQIAFPSFYTKMREEHWKGLSERLIRQFGFSEKLVFTKNFLQNFCATDTDQSVKWKFNSKAKKRIRRIHFTFTTDGGLDSAVVSSGSVEDAVLFSNSTHEKNTDHRYYVHEITDFGYGRVRERRDIDWRHDQRIGLDKYRVFARTDEMHGDGTRSAEFSYDLQLGQMSASIDVNQFDGQIRGEIFQCIMTAHLLNGNFDEATLGKMSLQRLKDWILEIKNKNRTQALIAWLKTYVLDKDPALCREFEKSYFYKHLTA